MSSQDRALPPPSDAELLDIARAARTTAYAPYSRFRVGAAIATVDGRILSGANVENAAYPAGVCAERVAASQAVVAGSRDFSAIAIVGDGAGPCTPCGMCRQFLYEFAPNLRVLASGEEGAVRAYILGRDLLPDGFGPRRLRT